MQFDFKHPVLFPAILDILLKIQYIRFWLVGLPFKLKKVSKTKLKNIFNFTSDNWGLVLSRQVDLVPN